jgi:hypothetical protein
LERGRRSEETRGAIEREEVRGDKGSHREGGRGVV